MAVSTPFQNDSNWHHSVGVYTGGPLVTGSALLYLDGVLASNAAGGGTPNITTNEFKIGGIPTVTFCCAMNGAVDEVRVSSGVRSADWVATEYANESSPSSFYTMEGQAAPNSPPTIQYLSPSAGNTGLAVTIQGYGFQLTQGGSTVTFNGVTATPTSWNDASIVVPVPTGATTGNVVVTIGGIASNGATFTMLPFPNIATLSPASGEPGTPVTIAGTNFGATQGSSTVTFNGVAATPTSWSATSITAPVPAGATTGNVVVTVGGGASNGVNFTVPITGISPQSGMVGTFVTITGSGFGASQGPSTVLLNAIPASVASWTNASIVVVVPAGATSGPFSVTINGQTELTPLFTVTTIPSGWADTDIGSVEQAGSAAYASDIFTVGGAASARATGIWGTADAMHFVYQTLTGDGSIIVRLASSTNPSNFNPQGGVMIRETLNPAATAVAAISEGNTYLLARPTTGATMTSMNGNGASGFVPPEWLQLMRAGDAFTGYVSSDGVNWTELGSTNVPMAQTVYIGLAVSANTATLTTATFDSVSVNSTTAPAPVISSLSATTASIGTQVQINGLNFGATQSGSQVMLNNVPMSVNTWSNTQIVFTILDGATSGPLVVSTAPGMNDSNPVEFEITTQPLSTSWMDQDVGAVSQAGSATFASNIFTVAGAGSGVGGTADGMHFVYQTLTGDGSIVARLSSEQVNSVGYAEAAVMIRETLNSAATEVTATAIMGTSKVYMQDRFPTGADMVDLNGYGLSLSTPEWLQLVRAGDAFTGYASSDGVNWTLLATTNVTMAQTVYIGLAVSGIGELVSATFDNVSVNSTAAPAPVITSVSATAASVGSQVAINGLNFGATQNGSLVMLSDVSIPINLWSDTEIVVTIPVGATSGPLVVSIAPSMNDSNPVGIEITSQPLPNSWLDRDVGAVSQPGSATYSNGTFTVTGFGGDYWNTSEGFHFVYQPLAGDGSIIARVTSDAGLPPVVMIRETLNAGSADAFLYYQPNQAELFYRSSAGASTASQYIGYATSSPYWLQLTRIGSTFTGFISTDGINWSQIGSVSVPMAQNVYMGLAVSGEGGTRTVTFDNVSVTVGTTPFVTSVSPLVATLGTPITITGSNFGSTQGTSTVKFNGVAATSITSWSSSQIVAAVPNTAPTGTGPVTVTVNSVSSPGTSGSILTILHPVITSVEPPSAPAGGIVIINGTGFGPTPCWDCGLGGDSVTINGSPVEVGDSYFINCPTFWCWNDTQIQVKLLSGITSGPLVVFNDGIPSNAVPFTVANAPVITGASPLTGEPSTVITVAGSGFGATQSDSTLAIAGIPALVSSWSDGQIVATVPEIAMNGIVTVTVAGITANGPLFVFNSINSLTASNGAVTTYSSGDFGGAWLLFSSAGPGCSSCSVRGNVLNTFDQYGNLLTTTDANGNTVTYTYDGNNDMLSRTAQLNGQPVTTSYTYNNRGEVLTMTDPLNHTTTNTYDDGNGNLLSVTSPAPNAQTPPSVTQFAYNTLGELTHITDPLGHPTTIAYYPTGLIQSITDAQNNTTSYAYDARGNRTSVIDPINGSSHPTTFAYDAMSRLTGITYPDGTSVGFGYDYRGRRTSATDQNGKTTTYAYDDADHLISVTDPASNVTQYNYDTENNLVSITDANNHTTHFAYDTMGRVVQTTFPSSLTETYTYDQLYNLTSKTDRKNQTIQYVYDSLYRMTSKLYPDQTSANYVYDLVGKILNVTDPTGTYGFAYDNMGRLIGTSTQYTFLPGHNFQNAYGYDAASNRTAMVAPDLSTNAYTYDTLNRLSSLTNSLTGQFGFRYDALNRRTSLARPNGINTNYSYDSLSHLLSVLHQSGMNTLDGASYTYDSAGNRTSKGNYLNGVTSNYGYDLIYELQQVTQGGSTTESYTYDPVGNRLSSLGVPSYSYNSSNELTQNSNGSYSYDANGNTISDPSGKTYTWDFENRLTQAVVPGTNGGTTAFEYDPFGRRIQKSGPLGTMNYLYDGFDAHANVVQTVDSSGSLIARYTQGGATLDEPYAELLGSAPSYYEADGVGSVTSLSSPLGALANTYTYDSFGKLTTSSGTIVNPFQYTGRELDDGIDLYYYRARYYDQNIGRFLSEDPIGFGAGVNFYNYVSGNPLNAVDPTGLQEATLIGCTAGPFGCVGGGVIDVGQLLIPVAIAGMAYNSSHQTCPRRNCLPCIPPVGTRAYRLDIVPPKKPHFPFTGTHWHLYEMHQNPNNCQCFWRDLDISGDGPPPPGTSPIMPPAGGGFM